MTPPEFASFWREEQGLVSREGLGQLVAAAEAYPPLRCRAVLAPAVAGMERLFGREVHIAELVARFPKLLLVPPAEMERRVTSIRRLLYDLPPRFVATRAAPLLYLPVEEVRARVKALQALLPGVDARRLCRKAVAVLLPPDPEAAVQAATAALRTHFGVTVAGDAAKVIAAAPALLAQHATVDQLLRERRALLEAAIPGVNAARLVLGSPVLLSIPEENLRARLTAAHEALHLPPTTPKTTLPILLSACPRLLSADSVALRKGLGGLYTALTCPPPVPESGGAEEDEEGVGTANGGLNITQLAVRCPDVLLKATTDATNDMAQRSQQWRTAFPHTDTAALFRKHPQLLLPDFATVQKRFRALEDGLVLGDEEEGDGKERERVLDWAALLRKAPTLLAEEAWSLRQRAARMRALLGEEDAIHLARTCPRLLLKDFKRNLVPKARGLARTLQPPPPSPTSSAPDAHDAETLQEAPRQYDHSLAALLRDSPQIFFYSSASLETKIRRLRAALPPALDVGAMVAAFPGLACMDVGSNVRLKVHYLTALWPSTADNDNTIQLLLLRALEADPRLLVHGFGRVSRAGFVVEALGGPAAAPPAAALAAVGMTWAEIQSHYPGYISALLSLAPDGGAGDDSDGPSSSLWTGLEARRGRLLKEKLLAEVGPEPPLEGEEREGKGKAKRGGPRRQASWSSSSAQKQKQKKPSSRRKPPPASQEQEEDATAAAAAAAVVPASGGWRRVASLGGEEEEEEEGGDEGGDGGDGGLPPPLPPRGKGFVIAISKGG